MIKIIIYTDKYGKTSARLVADLGYRKITLSWDFHLCAELMQCCVKELLSLENGEYPLK